MKKIFFLLFVIFLLAAAVSAENASIREEKMSLLTYMFSESDPVPNIGRIYPYFRFDGYTNRGEFRDWKMIVMENEFIKVYVCPDIGGKIWGAVEKSTGKEFIYFNHVVKFRDIGMRGAWTSGGLEYNFGDIGHIPSCATPVDYCLRENSDGSVSCSVGAVDLPSGTKWNVKITLPKNSAYFKTRAVWFNQTSLPVTYYHWMNASAKAGGDLEFIYPGNKWIGHKGKSGSWPEENGRNISFYKQNNFGRYKSYHVLNSYSDYMGGYWHKDDFGFGHLSDYDDKPGKKIWIWGLSDQGMIWEKLLTDSDGQYVEYQSGKLFNQAAAGSTFSPFKHREFYPFDSDVMEEIWFPLKGTKGMVAASEYAVLNVIRKDNDVKLLVSALKKINADIIILSGGKTVFKDNCNLNPLDLFTASFKLNRKKMFTLKIGRELLEYSSNRDDMLVERPVDLPDSFNWRSAYGLYVRAVELEKQREYLKAMKFYLESLKKESTFLPSLSRVALGYYRMMNYEESLKYSLKSLSVNTYDPLANYVFGLTNVKLKKLTRAKNGFSIAAQSVGLRSAAYTELAKIFARERKFKKALKYAKKSLVFNSYNISSLKIEAIVYRELGYADESKKVLSKISSLDPTGHFAAFENYLCNFGTLSSFRNQISNEFPFETYLDLSLFYYNLGYKKEAVAVLKNSPEHPLIYLWRSYLDNKNREKYFYKAIELPIEMIFPHRTESAELLEYFIRRNENWKLKYYLGLIYWNRGRKEEAKKLFEKCGNSPDSFSFYLAKMKLFSNNKIKVSESIKKAENFNGNSWRIDLARIKYYMNTGFFHKAEKVASANVKKHPEISVFGLSYAKALLKQKKYGLCIQFLEHYNVLPYEGATEGRKIYHKACIRAAITAFKKKKYSTAVKFGIKAKVWPENLGVGRSYDEDERLDDFVIALGYEKVGQSKKADKYFLKIINHKTPEYIKENSNLYIQAIVFEKSGERERGERLIESALKKQPDNLYIKWAKACFKKIEKDNLEKKILNNKKVSNRSFNFSDNDFDLIIDLLKNVSFLER